METAAHIRSNLQQIVAAWEREVLDKLAPAAELSRPALIDHLPEVLLGLAAWIEGDKDNATLAFRKLAEGHALQRLGFGMSLEALTIEHMTLRRVLMRELLAVASSTDVRRELIELHEGLDLAISQSVQTYTASRDTLRDRFIAILGHDLRTPLGAVLMSAQTLPTIAPDDERIAKVAARIERSARNMQRMIESVVEFARAHLGGGIPAVPTPHDMGALCRDAVAAVRAAHPDTAIDVETRGDLRGAWDGDRVHQALTNLVLNAQQHATHGVRVTAWESEDHDTVYTAVANDGPEIPDAVQATLFDPFVRGPAATRHGLGLGLYIVQQIALAHGALCTIDSSAGVTTFTISWPRARLEPDPRGGRVTSLRSP